MTVREKVMAGTVGAMMGGFVLYTITQSVLLAPAAEADGAVPKLESTIAEHERVIAREGYYRENLTKFKARTFGRTEPVASEEMRAFILTVARRSGMNTREDWSTSSFRGKRDRGVYQEVGWAVNARGSMKSVVNFLHLLQDDPRLHRIDRFGVMPDPKRRDMKVSLRYTSLVLDPKVVPKPKPKAKAVPPEKLVYPQLASAQRKQYDAIVTRDLFRPYVKRPVVIRRPPPPPPPRDRTRKPPPPPPPPKPPPIETKLKIVSLAKFAGRPEVCLRHTDTERFTRLAEGDRLNDPKIRLPDWQIAMVDYRPMPHPDNPAILSSSRAILRVGTKYWAVELGQTLSRKHLLAPDQLPLDLPIIPPLVLPEKEVSTSAKSG